MSGISPITWLTLLPFLGAVGLLVLPAAARKYARAVGMGVALLALGLALVLWCQFDRAASGLQFVERHAWIPSLAVDYFVGVDGLGLVLVLLSALVVPISLLVSWPVQGRPELYFALVLFLEAGLFGTFTALNFFHWFIFWELSLVPAFFLIKLWGGPKRGAAATQFFVYTMAGSIAMLLAFLAIFLATGTFDFQRLAEMSEAGLLRSALEERLNWRGWQGEALSMVLFGGVFLGFAVKAPMMPFHTWLPGAYAEAPTGTTILLTGALSKMGIYGFLRILVPIFPKETQMFLGPLLLLSVLTIVLSAFAALAQRDLKRLLAYSSINHLGYCALGISAAVAETADRSFGLEERSAALTGVVLQMFNHGLTAACLFAGVAFLERRSGGLREIQDFGGLRKVAPVFCGLMGISLFASLGLPGLNGFVGEFLIFKGSFSLATWAATLSVLGLLMTAVFLLGMLQRVFNGPLNTRWVGLADLTWTERLTLGPAVGLMFLIGIYPQVLIGPIHQTVNRLAANLNF